MSTGASWSIKRLTWPGNGAAALALAAGVSAQGGGLDQSYAAGPVDPDFQRPAFRTTVDGILAVVEDGRGGLLWPFANRVPLTTGDDQPVGFLRTDALGNVDTNFSVGPSFRMLTGAVAAPDGTIFLAAQRPGDRDAEGCQYTRICRISRAGQVDGSYQSPAFDAAGRFMALQPDGKLIVTSGGMNVGGSDGLRGIQRLDAHGRLDPAFQPPVLDDPNAAYAVPVVDGDGRLLIGGSFRQVNGRARPALARLLGNGSLDETFVPSGYTAGGLGGNIRGIVVQADGKIVVGGRGLTISDGREYVVIRLSPNGSLDPSFKPVPRLYPDHRQVRFLRQLADGRIVVAGDGVFVMHPDGSKDSSFRAPKVEPWGYISWASLVSDGRLLLTGWPAFSDPVIAHSVVCLKLDGTLDTTFHVPRLQCELVPDAVVVEASGSLLVAGQFDRLGTTAVGPLVRLRPDGSLDPAFRLSVTNSTGPEDHTYATNAVRASHVQPLPDCRSYALVAVGASSVGVVGGAQLHRLQPDGRADPTFPRPDIVGLRGVLLQGDRLVYWRGDLDQDLLDGRPAFGRLLPTGLEDPAFQPYTNRIGRFTLGADDHLEVLEVGRISMLGLDAGGGMLASVMEGTHDATTPCAYRVVRLAPDGARRSTFTIGPIPGGRPLKAYTTLRNPIRYSKYLRAIAAGDQANMDRYSSYDDAVTVIYPGDDPLRAAAALSDGSVVLGGAFDRIGDFPVGALAKVKADGSVDRSFGSQLELVKPGLPRLRPAVHSVQVDGRDRIWVTGDFNRVSGTVRNGVARLNRDGSLDPTFDPTVEHVAFTLDVSGVVADNLGAIYLHGSYRKPGEVWPSGVMRLLAGDPPLRIVRNGAGGLELRWNDTGRLESADHVDGPWSVVNGVQSAHLVNPFEPARFFRLKYD